MPSLPTPAAGKDLFRGSDGVRGPAENRNLVGRTSSAGRTESGDPLRTASDVARSSVSAMGEKRFPAGPPLPSQLSPAGTVCKPHPPLEYHGGAAAQTSARTSTLTPRQSSKSFHHQPLVITRLGLIDYQQAWDLQRRLVQARQQDRISDVLLLLEHPHTYTLGRRGKRAHILLTPRQLKRRNIAVYDVDRGGDVTYHGPEQLVGYPILKLPPDRLDYVRYIRDVEQALLLAVRDLGAPGELQEGFSGVWIGNEKLCAIGVKIDASGVTSHGFALNVNADLSYFDYIIPCGLADKGVTSLHQILGRRVSMRRVMDLVAARIAERFDLTPKTLGPKRLHTLLARSSE